MLTVEIHSLYLFDRCVVVGHVIVTICEVLTFLHNLTVLTLLLQDGLLYEAIILLIKILFQPVSAQLGDVAVDRGTRLHLGIGLIAGRAVHAPRLKVRPVGRVTIMAGIADNLLLDSCSILIV